MSHLADHPQGPQLSMLQNIRMVAESKVGRINLVPYSAQLEIICLSYLVVWAIMWRPFYLIKFSLRPVIRAYECGLTISAYGFMPCVS